MLMSTVSCIFLDEAVSSQCGVLIHCFAGVSRSATVTIAYLMRHRCMSFDSAHGVVSEKRSGISPNIHFLMQLKAMSVADMTSSDNTTAPIKFILDHGGTNSIVNSSGELDSPASYGGNSISHLSPSLCHSINTLNTVYVDSDVDCGGINGMVFPVNSSAPTTVSSNPSACTTSPYVSTDQRASPSSLVADIRTSPNPLDVGIGTPPSPLVADSTGNYI